MADRHESGEGIALARVVGLRLEECMEEFRRIRDQRLRVLVDGRHGPDGILSHVRVAVLEAGPG